MSQVSPSLSCIFLHILLVFEGKGRACGRIHAFLKLLLHATLVQYFISVQQHLQHPRPQPGYHYWNSLWEIVQRPLGQARLILNR